MVSVYPSVTAKKIGGGPKKMKPLNSQSGKVPPISKKTIGKMPKSVRLPPRVGGSVGVVVQEQLEYYRRAIVEITSPTTVLGKTLNTDDWTLSICGGCPEPWNAWRSGSILSCCGTQTQIAPLAFNTSPWAGTRTTKELDLYTQPVISGIVRNRLKRVGTLSFASPGPWAEPRAFFKPMPLPVGDPAPLVEVPVWPIAQPIYRRPAPTIWEAPGRLDEPSAEPEPKPKPKEWAKPFPKTIEVWTLPALPSPFYRTRPTRPGEPVPVPPGSVLEPSPGSGVDDPVTGPSPGPRAPETATGGMGALRFSRNKDYGRKNPPPPATTEHKVHANMAAGVIWAGINSLTEFFDFLVAMHDAVDPLHRLSKKASKRQIILYMTSSMKPWNNIDIAEGLENYINMEFSDYVAALGSRSSKKVARQNHIVTGLDRALNQHQGRLYDAAFDEGNNLGDDIPELDIDLENGVISISGPVGSLDWYLQSNTLGVRK